MGWGRRGRAQRLLEFFQAYGHVKLYYDAGQPAVSNALRAAFEYVLSRQAFVNRDSTYRAFRLAQVIDYLCAIELTAAKFEHRCETSTDAKCTAVQPRFGAGRFFAGARFPRYCRRKGVLARPADLPGVPTGLRCLRGVPGSRQNRSSGGCRPRGFPPAGVSGTSVAWRA